MDELSKTITKSFNSAVAWTSIIITCSNIFQNLLYQLFFTSLANTSSAKAFLLSGNMQSFYKYQRLTKIKLTRPIALTSCLCKIVERMINDRLVWYLEKHKLIVNVKVASAKTEALLINWCDFPYRNNM